MSLRQASPPKTNHWQSAPAILKIEISLGVQMFIIRSFLFFVITITNVFAIEYDYRFSLGSNITYIESPTQQARSFGISPSVIIDLKISEEFKFFSQSSALLETGSHKGTLLDEFKPAQQVVLNYAFFDYSPWKMTHFNLGALPMSKWTPEIHISATRFFGISFVQAFPLWSQASLTFKTLGAIPSNQELTNRLGGVSEGTPSYWQSGVALDLPGDILGINIQGYLWGYSDVNGNVAFQSGFMGNQTVGIGSANTNLAYSFRGYAGRVNLKGLVGSFNWAIGGDYIFNDGAPDERNQAIQSNLIIGLDKHQSSISWFDIQSDAVIGYYNSALYGHTNRTGFALKQEYNFDKQSSFGIELVRAKIKKTTLLQSDQDAVSIWWKVDFL